MKTLNLIFIVNILLPLLLIFTTACESGNSTPVDFEKEKEAIMEVIRKESKTYYEKDLEGWKNTYVMEPYQVRMGYWEGYKNKIQYIKGWDQLFDHKMKARFSRKTTNKWDESSSELKDINMRIFPEVAWVTYEQIDYEKDGHTILGKALGARVLEKKDGQWKIAYHSYMYYPQEEEETPSKE